MLKKVPFVFFLMMTLSSCDVSDGYDPIFVKNKIELLKDKCNIEFKHKIELLNFDTSDGREFEYNTWTIFSKTRLYIGFRKFPSDKHLVSGDLDQTNSMENRTGRKLGKPTKSYMDNWDIKKREISLILVRAKNGDYLVVTQAR